MNFQVNNNLTTILLIFIFGASLYTITNRNKKKVPQSEDLSGINCKINKRRSKGVTFWAWLSIISGIIGFLQVTNSKQNMQANGIGLFLLYTAISIAYLFCGIYLLKLNEAARKTMIVLSVISIIIFPFYFQKAFKQMDFDKVYLQQKQIIIEQVKPEFQQKELENLEKTTDLAKKVTPIAIIVIMGIPILLLELAPIYFFTRPKVKEQFK